jgi:hypothetical protein
MARDTVRPADIARRVAQERRKARGRAVERAEGTRHNMWRRETFTLPREEAREKAREFFTRFPKAAYMTEVESWRELADGQIEFTMRRLPSAD